MTGDTVVAIARLGHLGDGIGAGPSGPVFVPGALPGERVGGQLAGDRMPEPRILQPSPDRVRPPCAHARGCGGCALQHASDAFVAGWKRAVVEAALSAQGLPVPIRGVVTIPAGTRRRAALALRRTRSGAIAGFHRRGSDEVVEVPGCRVLHPELVALMPGLATLARIGATRQATLDAAVTLTLTGPDIAVTGGKPLDAAMLAALAAAAAELGAARLSWNGETVAMRAQPVVALGRARVPLPPGAFLQASAEAERVLVGLVREAVGGAARIADLFAGCGTFALPLAEAAEVHAVESDAAMTAALDLGWRGASGLRRVSVETRDLFRRPLLAAELRRHDAVVIDPPRAGAEAQTEQLAAARVPVIVAVSCNPVSLARDARLLVSAGYRLDWVQVVDQFRWSPHIELVARLSLPHIPAATTRGQG